LFDQVFLIGPADIAEHEHQKLRPGVSPFAWLKGQTVGLAAADVKGMPQSYA